MAHDEHSSTFSSGYAGATEGAFQVIDVFEFNGGGKVISMKAYWGPENIAKS